MTSQETRALVLGTKVFCTVRQCAGWYKVMAVRQRDGYIRVEGFKPFCPPHNFSLQPPEAS